MLRVGQGYDVHQLVAGRPLIIGGVHIPYEKGLLGHSDADVLLHAVTDACLGAVGLGDIGSYFPDNDDAYKNANSAVLLKNVWEMIKDKGYLLVNIDATIIAQKPKMAPYIELMKTNIAAILEAEREQINVKATTTEKLGFTGREEGIASLAVVLLEKV
ncbi:2-C-methyl-D-erythritol 2,4-cyclodiphosphate synthase [Caldifermentibacillus hisashii]|uniref:2-C-methyl-D-erythritol 2,4-cyclodiphosphate synthase n=2 Tax=Bacillaceae TaxID=186817 RepID=A0A090IQP5_9BACI|nr:MULTISPECIES: 2-C-methyl-D-erythritol 2,4-cyclodiphosphate synthase [Bacillaceae]KIO61388.1 2-C-methyl-D-erythritol 2,4-cyclodiphosphate synthase [Caldibacillus thermoamylovorans]MCM3055474.1 2-C-methyl-D-erythritol 2,4-cyclodiphosphate synthase [Caldibacillus thermoamylovorans]MCM3799125.1 2-C-methyl-D-erythritol 2,4-cyclodiphosphate synthase [Caldibacillus thermoamylovorans]MED4852432.1 2-C-methyl-D-erythritol 2,4-cyclodiphosphate synthase [Caldifermentibacillus hisashii]PAC35790.1 2-C-me